MIASLISMFYMKSLILFFLLVLTFTPVSAGNTAETQRNALQEHDMTSVSCSSDTERKSSLDGKQYNAIGFHCYERGSYDSAIKYYLKAMDLDPGYPVTYNNLGVVYLKRHEFQPAEQCFRRAIELNPDYVKAICNLAVVCLKQKRNTEALDLYNRAKKIDPSYVQKRVSLFKERN